MALLTDDEAAFLAAIDPIAEHEAVNAETDVSDPYPLYREYRQRCAVYEGDFLQDVLGHPYSRIEPGRPVFTILGYDEVVRVLRDWETYSSTIHQEGQGLGKAYGRNLLVVDPPEHSRLRSALQSSFAKPAIDVWREQIIDPLLTRELDGIFPLGGADIVEALALRFPVEVIHRMVGLPPEQFEEFWRLGVGLLLVAERPEIATACSHALSDMLNELIAERREHLGRDLVSALISARSDTGDRLTDAEILAFVNILLPAGGETTTRLIGTTLIGLLADSEQVELVRSNPDLIPDAVDEALRWEAPASRVLRVATRDAELAGVAIPKGAVVQASLAAANRDEAAWGDDVDEFDVRRRPGRRVSHMAFAYGPHMCLGMHLARAEVIAVLEQMLDRMPRLRLDPDQPPAPFAGAVFRWSRSIPLRWD